MAHRSERVAVRLSIDELQVLERMRTILAELDSAERALALRCEVRPRQPTTRAVAMRRCLLAGETAILAQLVAANDQLLDREDDERAHARPR